MPYYVMCYMETSLREYERVIEAASEQVARQPVLTEGWR